MTGNELEQEPPGHLGMMWLSSAGYKSYLTNLRKGGKSGISNMFGSAADILGPGRPAGTPLSPDVSPPVKEGRKKRYLYFSLLINALCRDFVNAYLAKCRAGDLGAEASKVIQQGVPESQIKSISKELTCISIFVTMMDQDGEVPDWLQLCLGESFLAADQLYSEPSADSLMEALQSEPFDYGICDKTATKICHSLGLQKAGQAAHTPVHQFLVESGLQRRDCLQQALTESLDSLLAKLATDGF